jgi:uncharacterized protein (TIGR03067 family)
MSDRKNLQGTWSITSLEMDGKKAPFAGGKIVIKGNRFTTIAMGGEYAGTAVYDESKSPKQFDVTFTDGPHSGEKSLGIYELDGDEWKICLGMAGLKRRPKEFATAPGSHFALEILRRGEIVEEVVAEEDGGPATELDGEWRMVSGSMDGHAIDPRLVKTGRRVSKGRRVTVLFGGQVYLKADTRLDVATKSYDYVLSAGATQQGIYVLEGSTLTVSMAAAGAARPADLKPGAGRTVTVWTRV